MSIEAINEQLLRAIGVGVALVNVKDLSFRFQNDTFKDWFGEAEPGRKLGDVFDSLETDALQQAIAEGGRYATETSFKVRRRTMSIAMDFNRALDDGEQIIVLVCQNISRIKELESMIDSYSMMVERNTREIKREKEQVEKLLLNMMPRSVYEEYKTFGVVTPRLYDPVSVLALDFAGFAQMVTDHEPGVIVSELNDIYSAFDKIGEQFGCERIKTVGDAYITVSGLPDPQPDHAGSVANAAVRFLRYLEHRNASHPIKWDCRIGLAAGNVIGSVVGVQKYIYDVFGPAVTRSLELRNAAAPLSIAADASIADILGDGFSATPDGSGTLTAGGQPVYALQAVVPGAGPGE